MELRFIFEILRRRKWLAINVFASIFLTIVIGTFLITPWYDSTAKVLLRKSSASSSALASIGLSSSGGTVSTTLSDTERADYLALASLRPIAEKVISEHNVKRIRTRARIMNAMPFLKPILSSIGVNVDATEEAMTAEDLLDASIMAYIFPRPYVSVGQYEDTDLIEIRAESTNPEQAKIIANAMAKFFIEEELKRVKEDYAGVKSFIDRNIPKAKLEYMEALHAVKGFKEKERLVDLNSETTNVIQKISEFKKSIEDNRLAIHKLKANIKNIESQLKAIPKFQKSTEQFKENDMIKSHKMALRDLYLSLAETKTKYTKDHPSVVDIENKIAQAKELLQEEMEKVYGGETISVDSVYQDLTGKLASYHADLAGYEGQNQALPVVISRYESEMMKLPKKVSDYSQLELASVVTQDVYKSVLKYQYQIGMAESMALSSIYLAEPAIAPKPNDAKHRHPDTLVNIIVALMLGSFFGIGATLLVEYIDDTIKTPDDVKVFKDVTFLGSIFCLKKKDPRLISKSAQRSPLREFIRTIRNSIKYASFNQMPKSILITSSIMGEGKSFFAANLAISVANEGKKVLIIDCDLRRPSVARYFDLQGSLGLTNYIIGDAEIKNTQVKTEIDNLTVMPSGPIPPDPGKFVESSKMQNLIQDMGAFYDLVIVDSPPVTAASDAIALGGWTDGTIIIVQSGRASRSNMADMVESFKRANINLIGAVLNMDHGRVSSSYYYYNSNDKKS